MTFDFGKLDKPQQKNRLIMEFGMMLAPLKDLAAQQTPPKQVDYIRSLAPFEGVPSVWADHAHEFARGMGTIEHNLVHLFGSGLMGLRHDVGDPVTDLGKLQRKLWAAIVWLEDRFLKLIDIVPLDWELSLSGGQTPFTFYMHVLDAVSTARNRLHYFDRYLKSEFYELYLRNLDRNLKICLVTTAGNQNYGVRAVTAVSDLFKQEFTNYRLIEVTPQDMHDRNLRIDDLVFTLGTSATDAGRQPTHFGPIGNTQAAHQTLDALIAGGTLIHQS
jgi:hypothetical protein